MLYPLSRTSQACRAALGLCWGLAFHKRKQSALDANSRILALSCMYRAPRVRRQTAPSSCSANWERERPPVWELLKQLRQQRKSQQPTTYKFFMLIPFPLAPRPGRDSELGLPNQQLKRVFSTLAHQLQVVTGRNVSPSTLTAAERYEQATGLD